MMMRPGFGTAVLEALTDFFLVGTTGENNQLNYSEKSLKYKYEDAIMSTSIHLFV